MSYKNIFRLTGAAAILAGSINIVFNLLVVVMPIPQEITTMRTFSMLFVLVLVLAGLYAAQAHRAGVLGLLGFILGEIGLVLNLCYRFIDIFVGPALVTYDAGAIQAILQGPYSAALPRAISCSGSAACAPGSSRPAQAG
jgi:hypothetical protein